jgi:hypothetical protein
MPLQITLIGSKSSIFAAEFWRLELISTAYAARAQRKSPAAEAAGDASS